MITSSIMGDGKLSVNWPEMIDLSMNLSEDPSLFRSGLWIRIRCPENSLLGIFEEKNKMTYDLLPATKRKNGNEFEQTL